LKIRGAKRIGRILGEHRELAFLMKTLTTIVRTIDLSVALLGDNSRILPRPLPTADSDRRTFAA
jgi:hypothetical protein